MKFEVIDANGQVVMTTDYTECIPAEPILKAMQGAGYKFRIDGKNSSISKLKTIIKG